MSKPISSYPEYLRDKVVARRLKEATGGLGHLSALDYQAEMDRRAAEKAAKEAK